MAAPIKVDPALLDYATDRQREILTAIMLHGTMDAATKALGVSQGIVSRCYAAAKRTAAKAGYAPSYVHNGTNLPGFTTRRISTARKADGSTALEWHIQEPAKEQQAEALREFVAGLCAEIPKYEPIQAQSLDYSPDILPLIAIGDAHIGMRAFGRETKHHNFDTDIATEQLREAVDYLVDKMDTAETGMLVDVGDYMHANGHANTTFSGTPLDVDTRHRSTMFEAAMCMRYMINRMLDKCLKVIVVVARGNHNDDAAPAIELMLRFAYENEPRVKVLETEGYYHYIEYGKNLLGITHGDKQKAESLVSCMSADMPQAWGRTVFRMWLTGHYHKEATKTFPGCKHKVCAALPPPDTWHSSHGFKGDGEMEMMTFKRSGGIQSTHVFNICRPILEPDVVI